MPMDSPGSSALPAGARIPVGRPAIIALGTRRPVVARSAFVAFTAVLVGDVAIGEDTGIFYGAVLRGDCNSVSVGSGSNAQDNVVLHADADAACSIGSGVSVGHGAVVHGATVEDDCLIGMGALVLNHAVIGYGSLVAAGSVVLEGAAISPGSLVAGRPATVRRALSATELEQIKANAALYRGLARQHKASR